MPSSTGPLLARSRSAQRSAIVNFDDVDRLDVHRSRRPSFTLIATFVVFGPSGNRHWKLPGLEIDGVPSTLPLVPQLG